MRYEHTGNVHKDFHLATNTTIRYVLDQYGPDFLRELFRRTAQKVYADIYGHLKNGDADPLLEHWKYYYDREDGKYQVNTTPTSIEFAVEDCPAVRHLHQRDTAVTDEFYLQSALLNDGWSEGTPFVVSTEVVGDGRYTMTIRKRDGGEL